MNKVSPARFLKWVAGTTSMCLILGLFTQPAIASIAVKNPPCPPVSSQLSGIKVLGFEHDGTGSTHLRVNSSDSSAVQTPQDLIGCYQTTEVVSNPADALWQVGVIDRDESGFFWKNAAGVRWSLALDPEQRSMTTGSDNPYFRNGRKFNFIMPPGGESGPCMIPNAHRDFGAGITAQPPRYFGKSEVVFKVIIPRFRDEPVTHSPETTLLTLELGKVEDFWNRSSFGRTKLILEPELNVTIPGRASDYDDGPGAGETKTNRFMARAYEAFTRANPSAKFDGLAFVFPTELDNFHAGYALALDALTGTRNDRSIGVTFVGSAPNRWGDRDAPIWKVLAHEIGHNFALPDYYITSRPEREAKDWAGLTPGPFDMMAHISARGNELLAWNRLKLGWLKPEEFVCLSQSGFWQTVSLTPVASQSPGQKAVIVPLNAFSAMVVESRQAIGSDSGLAQSETGLLVYTIDSRIGSGEGPIRIIPRTNEYSSVTWSPSLPDKLRHLKAPLRPGDRIKFGDVTIENIGVSGSDRLLIFNGEDSRRAPQVVANFKASYPITTKSLPLALKTDSDGPTSWTPETPEICSISGQRVQLRKAGFCMISFAQETNQKFFGHRDIFYFDVLPSKTIICKKGKVIRKVSGVTPKCPAGFKLSR